MHDHAAVIRGHHIPDHLVRSDLAPVEGVLAVVPAQLDQAVVKGETAVGDTVGAASHDGAEVAFTGTVEVFVDMVIPEGDILIASPLVGGPQRHDTSAVVGDLHGDIAIVEGVKRDLFPIHFLVEIGSVDELHLFFPTAGQQQGDHGQNPDSLHLRKIDLQKYYFPSNRKEFSL